ncbi:MAG: molybdenum cofactor guanylyltransferase, partial [Cyanobacteria bacterium J06642_11]
AALPRHLSRWEPLCGFYHRRCLPALTKAIQQNERSFQKWLANETVVPLQVTDPKMLRNCNTPAQWQIFVDNQTSRNP